MEWLRGSMVRVLFLIFFAATCMSVSLISYTQANTSGWFSSNLTIEQQDDSIYSLSLQGRDCKFRDNVPIKGVGLTAACITEGTKLRIAYAAPGTFVSKGRDQTFYPLNIPFDRFAILSPDTDRVVLYRNINNYSSTFAVYEEASKRLAYSNGEYVFQTSQPSFQYSQSPQFFTFPRLSSDGRFAVYVGTNAANTKFAVKTVNLETSETSTVGYILDTQAYIREIFRDIAVSDNGEYVALNTYAKSDGSEDPFRTIQVWRNRNCDVEASVACETRLATDGVPSIGTPSGITFNDNATVLTLMHFTQATPASQQYHRTTFSIPDLFRDKQLDYLAMGDSFSSGEGDTEGMHYIAGTNFLGDNTRPREMCHVSDRSYPFLLRDRLMPGSTMRSVACSGAVVREDYTGSEYGYKGQSYRLAEVPDVMRSQMKREALDISFIPGRNKQMTFVKKYQPKAVTITGGGNDAGFVDLIYRCAYHTTTCKDAYIYKDIAKAGRDIQAQYKNLLKLYKDLNIASSKTKIYAVGYPQFISENYDPCAVNIGMNKTERKFVRESVTMMNNVIEAAADTAGVKYIDIESALGENTLCGSSSPKYVTGISTDKPWKRASSNGFFSNESFHPNAHGHQAMTDAIRSALSDKSPLGYSYCQGTATMCPKVSEQEVPLTPFFAVAVNDTLRTEIGQTFSPQSAQPIKDSRLPVSVNDLGRGKATIRIESTPHVLGIVEVGDDGTIDTELKIPTDIEPGLHTLYIDAFTPAGEEITLWQYITIYGPDGDLDGNGVDDALQPCPFVVGSLQDSDGDGIDDRCDPEIKQTQEGAYSPPSVPRAYDSQQPIHSAFASDAAKALLTTESRQSTQRFLASDGVNASTSSHDWRDKDKQPREEIQGDNPGLVKQRSQIANFTWTNISTIAIMCIMMLIGFIYAKTHSKKQ